MALGVEELDPVVLGRIVGGGEDDTEILGEQRDGRSGQHTAEDGDPARGDDPTHERRLELRPGAARVPSDEDASAAGPRRRGTAELLDELERERLADDPAHAVGSEVSTSHG